MNKDKIAIAIDTSLLKQIDSLIDGVRLKSRSQAISYFLKKGLSDQSIKKAVLLLHKNHHRCALTSYKGKSFIRRQLEIFTEAGVTEVYLLTQESELLEALRQEIAGKTPEVKVTIKDSQGTGDSLYSLKESLEHENFLVMSGDTINMFELPRMILKHFENEKIATMGLVNQKVIKNHGVVLLDGALIIDFEEKPKDPKSHIVNAGIYIFRPEIFEFLTKKTISLEQEVFPQLAKIKQLQGYFTHGEYIHISEFIDQQ